MQYKYYYLGECSLTSLTNLRLRSRTGVCCLANFTKSLTRTPTHNLYRETNNLLIIRQNQTYLVSKLVWSTETPAPIVVLRLIFLMKVPLAEEGLALLSASSNAAKFS